MNVLLKLFAVLLFASPACGMAQEPAALTAPPSRDQIAVWLQHNDPREVAFAAVYALQEKDTELLPTFLALADRWEPLPHSNVLERSYPLPALTQNQRERRAAMAAILDAILQWRGTLSAATVQNLADDFSAQSIALLSQMPTSDAEPVLLKLYGDIEPSSLDTQRSAAALLALHPPGGFAASLLKSTTVATRVFVSSPGDQTLGEGRSSGSCGGQGLPAVRANWPQIGRYSLREGRERNSSYTVYATIQGLKPIDVARIVTPPVDPDRGVCGGLVLDSVIRMTLVAQMLTSNPERMPFKVRDLINLTVASPQDYERSLGEYVEKEQAAFETLKMQLAAKQLISPAEAADSSVLPCLVLVVSDQRSDKGFLLKQFVFRLPNVRQETSGSSAFFQ